jgi:methylated-DNA-[protein]-cysteine S-methyltransferase
MADSPFQKRVYDAVSQVPLGMVTTYKALAAAIGCGSAQAVGQALRHNPYAPEVPCHRVITASLSLGGYYGETSGEAQARKRELLEKEGVHFENGHLVDPKQCYGFGR